MNRVDRQRDHFNSIASQYFIARQDSKHVLLKRLIWNEFLAGKQFVGQGKLRVLEAMCGPAEGKKILEEHAGVEVDYVGFDYSDTVIARLRTEQPDLRVLKQDATTFRATESYDIAVLLGGLHHVPDRAVTVVDRLAAALRPGGYFINLEPTNGNLVYKHIRRAIYKMNKIFDQETERAFGVDELLAIFKGRGLSLVDVMYPGLSAYVLYYNPDAFPLFNVGGVRMVKAVFSFDRLFFRTFLGRKLSFATLSLWQKPA